MNLVFRMSIFGCIKVLILILCFASPGALAQQAAGSRNDPVSVPKVSVGAPNPAPEEGSTEAGYKIDTIRSVGPFGPMKVLDTPYTVTVESGDLIQNIIAGSQEDVWRLNPLVGSSELPVTYGGNPFVISRGFSVLFSDKENGIRLPYTPVALLAADERVELVSGLSSFLTGGASNGRVGGSVDYVTKRPTDTPLAELTAGTYGGSNLFGHLDASNKLDSDGKVDYRVNLFGQGGDTTVSNQKIDAWLASGALDVHAAPRLLVQFNTEFFHYRVDGVLPLWRLGTGLTQFPPPPDPTRSWSDPWTYSQRNGFNIGTNITYDILDQLKLRVAALYGEQRTSSIYDFNVINADDTYSQSFLPFAKSKANGGGEYAFLDWTFETGPLSHKITAGFEGDASVVRAPQDSSTHSTNTITGSLANPFYTDPASVQYAGTIGTLPQYLQAESSERSWILGDTIDLTHGFSSLFGVNHLEVLSKSYNTDGSLASRYDKASVTPTGTLMFKPLPQVLTYAGYMESLEPGAIVGPGFTNTNEILAPLVSKQYELGAKADVGKAQLTAALFRIDKGYQFSNGASPTPTFVQDGRQVNKGVEFTVTGKVTSDLTLFGGATALSPKLQQVSEPTLDGKDPVGVARRTAKLYAEYRLPFARLFTLTGGTYYSGRVYQNGLNTVMLPSIFTADLGARFSSEIAGHPLTLRLNATNIANRRYWITDTFQGQNFTGPPLNIAVSGTFAF